MNTINCAADLTDSKIFEELARILASEDFAGSQQLTGFLQFVVDETVEGRGDTLKERTIALKGLGRESDFDPRVDSIVRVAAGKLRRSLEHYYAKDGAANPLRIEMPKGSYQLVFRAPPELGAKASGFAKTDGPASELKTVGTQSRRWPRVVAACGFVILVVVGCFSAALFKVDGSEGPLSRDRESGTDASIVWQAGALPYRFRDGVVEVLLVRTRRDSHWTVPKATRDGNSAMSEIACAEAYQEAGVAGAAQPLIGEYRYHRKNKTYCVMVYPVLVTDELSVWPEASRTHSWFDTVTATELVASNELGAVIRDFQPN